MPDIIAHGKEANGIRACGICHLPNGKGLMQNGSTSGLPREYILQQLADFKTGKRHTADPNKANGYEMRTFPEGQPDKATVKSSGPFESWSLTLVYDARAGRWKIKEAENKYNPNAGG